MPLSVQSVNLLCLYGLSDAPDDLLNASPVATGKNVTLFPVPSGSIRDPGCPDDQFSPSLFRHMIATSTPYYTRHIPGHLRCITPY